jgi:hypothetical protein
MGGLALSHWLIKLLVTVAADIPRIEDVTLNVTVLFSVSW